MAELLTTTGPLAGRRILVTRAAERAESLAKRLRELGAEPLVCPTIAPAPPADPAPLAAALAELAGGRYSWLVLASVTAAEAVAAGLPGPIPATCRVAAVGPRTAAACAELLGRAPDLVPGRHTAAALAAALGDLSGARALLPSADLAPPELGEALAAAGASVTRVTAYRTVAAPPALDLAAELGAGRIDAVTFTSGSTARFLVEQLGPGAAELLRGVAVACIGPSTAAVCRDLGLAPAVVAEPSSEPGLVAALASYWERQGPGGQAPQPPPLTIAPQA